MSDDVVVYKAQTKDLARKPFTLPAGLLIGGGVVLLIANLVGFNFMSILWPGFIIMPALLLLWPAYQSTPERQSSLSFLAVPGAFLLTVGALLFTMNLFDHWETWAYAWVLLPASIVGGIMYMNRFNEDAKVHKTGYGFLRAMAVLFLALGLVFELLVFTTLGPWWPLAVIALGIYLFVKNQRNIQT